MTTLRTLLKFLTLVATLLVLAPFLQGLAILEVFLISLVVSYVILTLFEVVVPRKPKSEDLEITPRELSSHEQTMKERLISRTPSPNEVCPRCEEGRFKQEDKAVHSGMTIHVCQVCGRKAFSKMGRHATEDASNQAELRDFKGV